jgi:hypothetical protein
MYFFLAQICQLSSKVINYIKNNTYYCHLPIGYHSNRHLSNYLCPKKTSKRSNFEIIVMHSINLITDYNLNW